MKIEIYQIGKLPPLTTVECDDWELHFDKVPRLILLKKGDKIAEFFVNNIAGFKEVEE